MKEYEAHIRETFFRKMRDAKIGGGINWMEVTRVRLTVGQTWAKSCDVPM